MYCRKCGTKLSDDALFCVNCGEKVVENKDILGDNQNNQTDNNAPTTKTYAIALVVSLIIVAFISGISGVFTSLGIGILYGGWHFGKKAFKSKKWMKLIGIIVCCFICFSIVAVVRQVVKDSNSRRVKRYSSTIKAQQYPNLFTNMKVIV